MTTVQPGSGSLVRRLLLGAQLRRLREAHGVTREQAGYHIRASESKISRLELGRVGFKERDVADLLTLYGVLDESERSALLDMAREANVAGWWHSYSDVLPPWFQTYVGLEEAAELIRSYDCQFVHPLLQTEDYARAVISQSRDPGAEEDVERRVGFRMERQKRLVSERAPQVHAVLDEAVLRRPFGGVEVLRAQLERLLELNERSRVVLRVLPATRAARIPDGGSFTMLHFSEAELGEVVYLEQLAGALYLDKPEEVVQYAGAFLRLGSDCLSRAETADFIRALLRDPILADSTAP
ncbi:helix-turn-helix domain-containing protein [Streptacidiphilus sp. EB129]|uniref:helix-turn-helix domain-containing protein n=1 Tax=Streptacidiphilus sp. EB129 TaxID=3156262 RepID=UPI00351825CE